MKTQKTQSVIIFRVSSTWNKYCIKLKSKGSVSLKICILPMGLLYILYQPHTREIIHLVTSVHPSVIMDSHAWTCLPLLFRAVKGHSWIQVLVSPQGTSPHQRTRQGQELVLKLRNSSMGLANPQVPASPFKRVPGSLKVGLLPALPSILFKNHTASISRDIQNACTSVVDSERNGNYGMKN